MRKFKKEKYIEDYEKNLAIFALFIFIFLGVGFITFILPKIYEIKKPAAPSSSAPVSYQNQKNVEDGYKSGINAVKNNNYSEALGYFQKAVDTEPNNISYLTELATTHYKLTNYDEAIKTYNKIIVLEKDNAFAYNNIGNIYSIKKDYVNAESYFRKAIEVNPASIQSYSNLALMFDENNKKDEAVAALKQGIKANPDSVELKIVLRIVEE